MNNIKCCYVSCKFNTAEVPEDEIVEEVFGQCTCEDEIVLTVSTCKCEQELLACKNFQWKEEMEGEEI